MFVNIKNVSIFATGLSDVVVVFNARGDTQAANEGRL